jgi:hypothetical protein
MIVCCHLLTGQRRALRRQALTVPVLHNAASGRLGRISVARTFCDRRLRAAALELSRRRRTRAV